MSGTIRSVRGFNDILPAEVPYWRRIETAAAAVLEGAGYEEIRLPLVESTQLFARSIGASTDIVEKEMYSFDDRGGGSLSLRPEGTAGCVRAGITHGLFNGSQQRLWYQGPMFRHERPQKGRYRQFHQIGAEAFGIEGPEIEAELLIAAARLWRRLGLDSVALNLNSLGSFEDRGRYRAALIDYLEAHAARLDEDSRRRLATNPLRILDSKAPETRSVLADAPRITDYLSPLARDHLERLCDALSAVGIGYTLDPFLVRGLDYYTGTVFEWTTTALGAQNAVCSGGRYDNLVAELGGRPTPAAGWALGLERLVLLVQQGTDAALKQGPDVYFVALGSAAERRALVIAEGLREAMPELRLVVNAGGGSLKSQLRRADKAGARLALILGETELAAGKVTIKGLAADGGQETVTEEALSAACRRLLGQVSRPRTLSQVE